jgi:hypothetical protein
MSGWLAGLGSAFLHGSDLMARNRAEEIALAKDEEDRKARQVAQALAQDQFNFSKGRAILEDAGPNGMLTPEAAEFVKSAGMGGRIRQQEALLPSNQFEVGAMGQPEMIAVPGQEAGFSVAPTAQQQFQLDQQASATRQQALQDKYMAAVNSAQFATLPPSEQQKVWTLAGLPGQPTKTGEQMLAEQKPLLDYQQKLRMQELNTMYPPNRFGNGGTGGGQGGAGSAYAAEKTQRTINMIDELLGDGGQNPGLVDWTSAGPMGVFGQVPIGPQHTLHNKLQALGANIAFTELAEMRNASKTGGALGNVSNVELELLQNAMGAIQQTNDPRILRAELSKIKQSLARWENAKIAHGMGTTSSSTAGTPGTPPPAGGGPRFRLIG